VCESGVYRIDRSLERYTLWQTSPFSAQRYRAARLTAAYCYITDQILAFMRMIYVTITTTIKRIYVRVTIANMLAIGRNFINGMRIKDL